MNNQIRTALFWISLFCTSALYAVDEPGLFTDHKVLKLTLSVDFNTLCRPRDDDNCGYLPTTLIYETETSEEHDIPVEIQIRGGWRALREHCVVPPLFVRFSAADIVDTPFSGQNLLPLTTHCRSIRPVKLSSSISIRAYEQYVLKEYLGYRLYNQLSDVSLRVRLAHITYQDPENTRRTAERYAFFTEHFDSMAARHNASLLERGSYDTKYIDRAQTEILALFHFMIGNTDWSLVRQRNTILIAESDGTQLPAMYDLDMSGLVDAHYAAPAPDLHLINVRRRLFQGYCPNADNWQPLLTHFQERHDDMIATIESISGLTNSNRRIARKYLQSFFDILDSAKQRDKYLITKCQMWPPPPTTEPFSQ